MDKHFTFDDMINTMMPLPISGEDCQDNESNGFDLRGIFCQYCVD